MSAWQRQKNWWNEVLWKPKKALSLDQLKFQHHMLLKNPVVTENNKQLLVETFRSIAEILIWGDQNDSRVFDFFLEKNMQAYFLKILTQKCGRYVCVQLLQTLNILFENIRNETSIYYLLSNNHINSIIVLKLDFSDEEVLAYYISFLKTLSFHLNKHTIHFFYNEHLRDFPLYTEAIKFFKHSESMVRIAVRTLTLNVYRVNDPSTLDYICNKTAAPYFSNLVWFIGNHVIELDECLISQAHHLNRGRLEQLVAEHLDHLHYISDIFSLGIQCLDDILSDHLLNRLLIPLYIYSLVDEDLTDSEERTIQISSKVSLFLLSQVFLILSHPSVITPLVYLIFTGDMSLSLPAILQQGHKRENSYNNGICAFVQPETSLETSLVLQSSHAHANPITMTKKRGRKSEYSRLASESSLDGFVVEEVDDGQYVVIEASPSGSHSSQEVSHSASPTYLSRTKPKRRMSKPVSPESQKPSPTRSSSAHYGIPIVSSQFLNSLMSALAIYNDDSRCLFALSILYAMLKNKGNHHKLLEAFSLKPKQQERGSSSPQYNSELVALLLSILDSCTSASNCIRLITLRLTIMLLEELLEIQGTKTSEVKRSAVEDCKAEACSPLLHDHHIALIENIYESAILRLRLFYKGPNDEIFLDLFENEYDNEKSFKLNLSYLMMDETMLLPPSDTPLTGIDFTRRLPCGEYERARKAMRVFFAIRKLSQQMSGVEETELPLTTSENSSKIGDVLDMTNYDLVSCKVTVGETTTEHFMVFTETEFLLVNPHKSRLGCGVVHFISFLQDIDASGDPADGHALYIIAYHRNSSHKRPSLSGRFVFEDHIRCSAAKSVLQRSRENLHYSKMTRVAKMLHLPLPDSPSVVPTSQYSSQQRQHVDLTPPSVISYTPPQPIISNNINTSSSSSLPFSPPSQSQLSSSVLHKVFHPSGLDESTLSQQIEMSSLNTSSSSEHATKHSFQLGDDVPSMDSPVCLALPSHLKRIRSSGSESNDGDEEGIFHPRDTSSTPEPSKLNPESDLGLDPGLDPGQQFEQEETLTINGGLTYVSALHLSGSSEGVNSGVLQIGSENCADDNEVNSDERIEEMCPLGVELGGGDVSNTAGISKFPFQSVMEEQYIVKSAEKYSNEELSSVTGNTEVMGTYNEVRDRPEVVHELESNHRPIFSPTSITVVPGHAQCTSVPNKLVNGMVETLGKDMLTKNTNPVSMQITNAKEDSTEHAHTEGTAGHAQNERVFTQTEGIAPLHRKSSLNHDKGAQTPETEPTTCNRTLESFSDFTNLS